MVIGKFNIPIYGIILLLSLVCGIIYDYIYLKRNKIENRDIFLFLILIIPSALFGGIGLSKIIGTGGLSSFAAALSLLIIVIIYEKVLPHNGLFIKVTILSLPLMYSIAKIGCFLAGCCEGIPYNGILSVTYTNGANMPLFPVQLLESISFMILFIILNKIKSKNIIYITLITCSILKYLLDFLRYSHIGHIITDNQLLSLILLVVTIIYMIIKKNSN